MMTTRKQARQAKRPAIYVTENPVTHKMERVSPESPIAADQLVIPMFWANGRHGGMYVTVPGTEFYGRIR